MNKSTKRVLASLGDTMTDDAILGQETDEMEMEVKKQNLRSAFDYIDYYSHVVFQLANGSQSTWVKRLNNNTGLKGHGFYLPIRIFHSLIVMFVYLTLKSALITVYTGQEVYANNNCSENSVLEERGEICRGPKPLAYLGDPFCSMGAARFLVYGLFTITVLEYGVISRMNLLWHVYSVKVVEFTLVKINLWREQAQSVAKLLTRRQCLFYYTGFKFGRYEASAVWSPAPSINCRQSNDPTVAGLIQRSDKEDKRIYDYVTCQPYVRSHDWQKWLIRIRVLTMVSCGVVLITCHVLMVMTFLQSSDISSTLGTTAFTRDLYGSLWCSWSWPDRIFFIEFTIGIVFLNLTTLSNIVSLMLTVLEYFVWLDEIKMQLRCAILQLRYSHCQLTLAKHRLAARLQLKDEQVNQLRHQMVGDKCRLRHFPTYRRLYADLNVCEDYQHLMLFTIASDAQLNNCQLLDEAFINFNLFLNDCRDTNPHVQYIMSFTVVYLVSLVIYTVYTIVNRLQAQAFYLSTIGLSNVVGNMMLIGIAAFAQRCKSLTAIVYSLLSADRRNSRRHLIWKDILHHWLSRHQNICFRVYGHRISYEILLKLNVITTNLMLIAYDMYVRGRDGH